MKTWWSAQSGRNKAFIVVGMLVTIAVVASGGASEQIAVQDGATAPAATSRPAATTAAPTPAPATPTPTPRPTPTPEPSPIVISGRGDFATDPLRLGFLANATLTHNGSRNFIVYEHQGSNKNLLVNTIGRYEGTRPLWAENETLDSPRSFEIRADGAWTITLSPLKCCAAAGDFVGHGDAVSALIRTDDTTSRPWEITHTGTRNFIVYLHCDTGSRLVVNKIGTYSGSTLLSLSKGFCIWEVRADGDWSIHPRN